MYVYVCDRLSECAVCVHWWGTALNRRMNMGIQLWPDLVVLKELVPGAPVVYHILLL